MKITSSLMRPFLFSLCVRVNAPHLPLPKPIVPANAVTFQGSYVTLDGAYVTYTGAL